MLQLRKKKKNAAAERLVRKNLEVGVQEYLLSQGRNAQEGGFASDEEVKEFTKNVQTSVKAKIRLSEWMQGGPLACLSSIANLDLVLGKVEWEATYLYLNKWVLNIKDCQKESSLFPTAQLALHQLHVACNNLVDPGQYETLLCMAPGQRCQYEYHEVSDVPLEVREKIGHRFFVVHLAHLACKVWESPTMRNNTGEGATMKNLTKVYLEPHSVEIAKVVGIRMETFTSDILFLAKLQEALAEHKGKPLQGGQHVANLQTSGVVSGSFDCASTCAHTRTHTLTHEGSGPSLEQVHWESFPEIAKAMINLLLDPLFVAPVLLAALGLCEPFELVIAPSLSLSLSLSPLSLSQKES
jgi:hypothetical protein